MNISRGNFLKAILIIGFLVGLYMIRVVFVPFILAAIIAYLINPVVRYLENRQVPRVAAIIIVYLAILVATIIIILFIIPIVSAEVDNFMHVFPREMERIKNARYQAYRGYRRDGIPETLKTAVDGAINDLEEGFIKFLRGIIEGIINLFSHLFNLILAPVLAFYMTKDIEALKEAFFSLVPWSKQGHIERILSDIDKVIGGYVRGQVMVTLIIGFLSSVGLYIIGVDFSIILGLIAGLTNVIPYFGPVIGAIPSICIASIQSPHLTLRVVILFAIVQQIDNTIVSPKIIGDSVGLHPLVVIFALLTGGQIMGIVGMLLAVPMAATVKVILKHIYPIFIRNDG